MKTSTLLAAGLYAVLATRALTALAADPRMTMGPGSVPQRGLFGLPVPQQWCAGRSTSPNGIAGYRQNGFGPVGYQPTGYNANCPNGNCQARSGYSVQAGYAGSTDIGMNPGCVNGQCRTGACANGQCTSGPCVNGQCGTGNCPNGNCGTVPWSSERSPLGSQTGWSPRNPRTGVSDLPRRTGEVDSEGWVPRTRRPVLEDALNSRYHEEELNLRSDYFGPSGDERTNFRPRYNDSSRQNSNEWNRPTRRSLEAPETSSGVARF